MPPRCQEFLLNPDFFFPYRIHHPKYSPITPYVDAIIPIIRPFQAKFINLLNNAEGPAKTNGTSGEDGIDYQLTDPPDLIFHPFSRED